jgi:hypothetical protein
LTNSGASGGPSRCAAGSPSIPGVVSGTCAGYAKPSWQSGVVGIPQDGVRDLPDVSLFAANGVWNHYYLFCFSDAANGGTACTGNPSGWTGAGGTSFAAPIVAGIQALINVTAGGAQGNPNYRYYQLAAGEYGAGGSSACNATNGNAVASSCIFYDVTIGDIDANCTGAYNCYLPAGNVGVLSTSTTAYAPAFPATLGWDFATGIGTVNVANLVANWKISVPPPTTGAAHDFDGDGKSDIAWASTDGAIVAWLMNAAQVAQDGTLGVMASNWQIVGQRDFNGDGKCDLAWRDANSGTVAIWLLNGLQVLQTGTLGAMPSNWVVAGTSDFNGDGKGDILWRDTNTGAVVIWLLNGLQIL